MNYKEFTQRVKQHLLSRPGYASPPASIQENSRDLIIMLQEQQIPLKLEIESYYGIYQYGVPFEDVLKAIETAAEKIRNHIAEDQKMVRDYKQAKELLTVELVNAEEKKEILKKIPHKMIGDMAVFCKHFFLKNADCILRSPADFDAFQSGRCAEHNGRPETPIIVS